MTTAPPLSDTEKVHLFHELMRIRRFQVRALFHYNAGHMGGFLLLNAGQEGIPVALKSLMSEHDHLICGPRSIAYALAMGVPASSIMAELFGKLEGCAQGKGGMFGIFGPQHHFHGSFASAGAQAPVATGLAFALKYQEKPGVALCILGDGATNQGAFHEALNLASLFNLPVVFVIENNQFSMGTSVPRHSALKTNFAQRAENYDMAWDLIEDGSDLLLLRDRLAPALERARREHRPTVVEIKTYRYYGFTIADANAKRYRTSDEIEFEKKHHDPLTNWKNQLIACQLLTEKEAFDLSKHYLKEADAAAVLAKTSPPPSADDLLKHIYWEVDHQTGPLSGQYFFE
ncbi:thiamine pyrophosphate-dependent dehydrogenase E1 component subunit alpha [Roseibacillus persicicus]|uniref:Pyruvate dehydrogenase E1 component subunit alpha n=1 Tax=Roseibacillus persicicus TaxID=454148 RepID=A0A918TDX0_9BACT|nr:thiamine pyrophosphate-dependent enzyme [Roseibacillus persicicus]GHC41275.1 pyruvate dehydrogenase E1 component subunit alpha [Roseibacillus persicicus]